MTGFYIESAQRGPNPNPTRQRETPGYIGFANLLTDINILRSMQNPGERGTQIGLPMRVPRSRVGLGLSCRKAHAKISGCSGAVFCHDSERQ